MLVEICCGSLDDALAAQVGGADRIELNSALFLGGLTPSGGTLRLTREQLSIPIFAMVRPRVGGFHYTAAEFEVMQADARLLCELGADGLVFGCLDGSGEIDRERTARLVDLAGGRPTVFHRAFDVVPDPFAALETLIELGVTRILTSGQEETAYNGAALIRQLREAARGRMEILPGGGIDPFNIADVITRTGTDQVHLALFTPRLDTSCQGRPQVYFGGGLRPSEDRLEVIDTRAVARLRGQLGNRD